MEWASQVIILAQIAKFTKLFTKFNVWFALLKSVTFKCDGFLPLGALGTLQRLGFLAFKPCHSVFFAPNDQATLLYRYPGYVDFRWMQSQKLISTWSHAHHLAEELS